MRSSALLLAALALGCRRAAPAPAAAPDLAAPAPSSAVVTSPLDAQTSGYTNEMQAQNLRDQAAELGIDRLAKPSFPGEAEGDAPRRTITYQEGIERTRELARDAEAERHAIDGDKNKSVALPTPTPGMISGDKEGSPIEKDPGTP